MWVRTGRRIQRSTTEQHLGVQIEKLDRSQKGLLAAQNTSCVLHQNRNGKKGERGDCSPLLCFCESPSAVLQPGLGTTAQEKCRLLMWVQKRAMKMIRGLWRKAGGAGLSEYGDEKAQERHHYSLLLLKGNLGERANVMWSDNRRRGNIFKLKQGKI